jgi:hypothetical protein
MRYELTRSKRKTLALTLNREGSLVVRAPLHMSLAQIEAFINQKRVWVEKTRARLAALPPRQAPLTLTDGAALPYLGGTLTLVRAAVPQITALDGRLLVPLAANDLTPVCRWVDTQARGLLAQRMGALAAAIRLYPKTLRLTHAKGRWGSMSTRGTLSLNRALLMCPPDVIDYVIVHELCHIAHPNHSPAFWALVERYLPDYRVKRDWLKTNTSLIAVLPA